MYLLWCLGMPGEVSKQQQVKDNNLTVTLSTQVFVTFCFFQPECCFPCWAMYARNHFSTSTLWAKVRLNFEEHIKQARQLTELLLFFHENNPKENKGSSILLTTIIWPITQYRYATEVHLAWHKTEIKTISERDLENVSRWV